MRMKSLDYYNYISHNDNRQTCVTLEIVNIIDCIKFFQVIIIIHNIPPEKKYVLSLWPQRMAPSTRARSAGKPMSCSSLSLAQLVHIEKHLQLLFQL